MGDSQVAAIVDMCGRFTIATRRDRVEKLLNGLKISEWKEPNYDVRPTDLVPAVLNEAPRELVWIRWGLVPPWADDVGIGSRMINARSETIADKPSFRAPFQKRRCLIVSDGFFEWKAIPGAKRKQQMWFHLDTGEPFVFAGLWDVWKSPQGEPLRTCTILTMAARGDIATIHERMPVIPSESFYETWLSDKAPERERLAELVEASRWQELHMEPWSPPPKQGELL